MSADPGHSASLQQNIEAAYGPYADADNNWYGDSSVEPSDAWWFVDQEDEPVTVIANLADVSGVGKGEYYVGNYFNID